MKLCRALTCLYAATFCLFGAYAWAQLSLTHAGSAGTGGLMGGLISYWQFNEGSGFSFADIINGFNGTLTANNQWNVGSVVVDVSNTGSVPNQAAFNVGSAMTAFGWVDGPPINGAAIFAQYDLGTNQRAWSAGTSNSGSFNTLRVVVSDDGTTNGGHYKDYTGSQVMLDSSWHSFAMRFNAGTLDLFVDGVKDTSVTKSTDGAITTVFNSPVAITFGAELNSGSAFAPFAGSIQRFRLYNAAKTDADIAAMHALGHL